MMNALTEHPHQQGVTYFEHWAFAMGIAWRLLTSVVAFALHAILPFISIEPHLDLEATAAYLAERNQFIEAAAAEGLARPTPHYTPAPA
jgi:hypothetical protein